MRLRDVPYNFLATVTIWGLAAGSVFAQATGGNMGDPAAPLDFLRTARQKAQSSQLNASSIAQGGNNAGIVISIIFAVVGMALAGFSGVKVYKAAQDDNAREDTGRSVAGFVIGALITILGVAIGVVTNYMTGNG